MPLRRENFTFRSPIDRLELESSAIFPEQPRGIVQLVHGMAEHKGRYTELMEYLARRGWAVFIHNHRGHGNCAIPGYFGTAGAEGLIGDTRALSKIAREKFPGLPLYLFGHSMGSLVARCYLKRFDDELDGLLLCGTPYSPPAAVRAGSALIAVRSRLLGETRQDQLVNSLITGSFNRRAKGGSPNQWLSASAENVEAFNRDPLCGFCFTLNGFQALMQLMKEAYSPEGWALKNTALPVHVLSGAEDPCHGGRSAFLGTVQLIKEKGYPVTWRLFHGMRHEIFHEDDGALVFDHIEKALHRMEKA